MRQGVGDGRRGASAETPRQHRGHWMDVLDLAVEFQSNRTPVRAIFNPHHCYCELYQMPCRG